VSSYLMLEPEHHVQLYNNIITIHNNQYHENNSFNKNLEEYLSEFYYWLGDRCKNCYLWQKEITDKLEAELKQLKAEKKREGIDKKHSRIKDTEGELSVAKYKAEISRLKQENDDLQIERTDLRGRVDELIEKNNTLTKEISDLKNSNRSLETKVQESEKNYSLLVDKNTEMKKTCENPNSGHAFSSDVPIPADMIRQNDVIASFNTWAAKPSSNSLPQQFYYFAGDPKERYDMVSLTSGSDAPTKWIVNKAGHGRQYLLPNPCLFNEGTDISTLYVMKDTNNLKARGKNKIEIVRACEIQNEQIILCGELRIL